MEARLLPLLLAALLAAPALAPAPGAAAASQLVAGAARAELTPPVGTPLWGYTARHAAFATLGDVLDDEPPRALAQVARGPDLELYAKSFLRSEGVHTRLYANAFVLDDGSGAVAIVQVDLGAFPGELHQGVAERLAAWGVPVARERLLVGATHTHGGPGGFFQAPGYALLGGDAYDPRVFGFLADQIAHAVRAAWEARVPAALAVGVAPLPGASGNRSPGAHSLGHGHDRDHVKAFARVVRVDALDGRPLGAITVFAAHGTIVDAHDLLLSGDHQGVAARLVARGIAAASGQREHDVVVAYLNGAEGDVSPRGSGPDFLRRVEDAGARQAGPILDAWRGLAGRGAGASLDARLGFLCFCAQEVQDGERISPVAVLGKGGGRVLGLVDAGGPTLPEPLGIPGHGRKVPLLVAPGSVPQAVRLQAVRLGDLLLLAVPGEMSMALGEQLEQDALALATAARPVAAADVVGLANDYVSYMSTVPEYDAQDYEGTFNLYGRMTGPLFRAEMRALVAALQAGAPPAPLLAGLADPPSAPTPTPPPLPLLPARPPAVLAEPPAQVPRGGLATFAWAGGAPSVDHPPDAWMVQVRDAASGAVVHDDRGFELRVRYAKEGADVHRWGAEWVARPGVPAGAYRFHVEGRHVAAPGHVAPYALDSAVFEVQP